MIVQNLTGQKFNRYLILRQIGKNANGRMMYECLCDCGSIKIVAGQDLKNGHTKSCGCYHSDEVFNRCYTGTKDISQKYFTTLKNNAKKRKIKVTITLEYIQQLLEQQNYKCAISGLSICGSKNRYKGHKNYQEQTASLDRIDSTKDYKVGNVQWVHKTINYMKRNLSDEEFIQICKIIVNYQGDLNEIS